LAFFEFEKNKRYEESEKIFSKFLLPIHQRFSSHKTLFKHFPCLTLEAKIKLYTIKVLKNFEDAKFLSESEKGEDDRIKLSDEKFLETNDIDYENTQKEIRELQKVDLDYETIHSEILENIIFEENESGLSDFDEKEEQAEDDGKNDRRKEQIFDIVKIKNIIHKSVESLFEEEQENDEFKPLLKQEKEIAKNSEDKLKENRCESITNNTEMKTQDFTVDIKDNLKEECFNKINTIDMKTKNEENKEDEIINYRRYNYLTDPNSNYNNFSKKYEIKTNPKKRFRDIHPFLKTFNPKFLKKENIDKKIFRRFRKFVKSLYKKNKNLPVFIKNPLFWRKFYVKNLLPPVKIVLNHNGNLIEHKSFNTQYLIWLFNQQGTTELFEMFAKNELEFVINNFIEEYDLSESKEPGIIEKIKQYIKYIPEIYGEQNQSKEVILEENMQNFEINYPNNKDEEDLDSIDSGISSSNPFNLKFDEIGKKDFKETPYDEIYIGNDNSFCLDKKNSFNDYFNQRSESQLSKLKFIDDDSYYSNQQFKGNYFK